LKKSQKKLLFWKKSNQKTFGPAGGGKTIARAPRTESLFASFSSEKEALPSSA
jgi:hypothetical protein